MVIFFYLPRLNTMKQTFLRVNVLHFGIDLTFCYLIFQVCYNLLFVNLNIWLFWGKTDLVVQQQPAAASVQHTKRQIQTSHCW